jgi:AcrR family transcriptional regulator
VPTSTGIRARVRGELIQEIKAEARRQVAEAGGSALSLRAVARELGMVSSGIYRYFPSRDQLLTALIIDAYDDLGAGAEAADATCKRNDFAGRWRSVCHAVRDWALGHPNEYALTYGSPVPGYHAPQDTVGPASRSTLVLAVILRDAGVAGALHNPFRPEDRPALSTEAKAQAAGATQALPPPAHARAGTVELNDVPPDAVVRALTAWTQLFGFISFEIFGRFVGVVDDTDAVFAQAVTDMGAFVGITMPARPLRRRPRSTPG